MLLPLPPVAEVYHNKLLPVAVKLLAAVPLQYETELFTTGALGMAFTTNTTELLVAEPQAVVLIAVYAPAVFIVGVEVPVAKKLPFLYQVTVETFENNAVDCPAQIGFVSAEIIGAIGLGFKVILIFLGLLSPQELLATTVKVPAVALLKK